MTAPRIVPYSPPFRRLPLGGWNPFAQQEDEEDPILEMRRIREAAEAEAAKPPLIPTRAASDATARPGYRQPPPREQLGDKLGQPTIGPVRRGVQLAREPDLPTRELETGGTLGIEGYGLGDAIRDVVESRGAFAPNKPAGALLDFTNIPGAARMGYQAAEQFDTGHPVAGGVTSALAFLPFMGKPAKRTAKAMSSEAREIGRAAEEMIPRNVEPLGTAYKAPIDAGADPRLANIKKLNLSPEAETKVRDAYTRLDLSKRTVTHEETKAAADELGIAPNRLLNKAGRLRGDELLAVRDVISQNAHRMVELGKERAAALTDDARRTIDGEISQLSEQTDEFLRRYSTERTRAGRDLNALKIVARNSMEPSVWLAQAQRVKRELPLSTEEAMRVTAFTQANDRDGLVRYITSLHKSSAMDKTLALWKAGMLTAIQTTGVNTVGNVAMGIAETAKDVPAAAIDAIIAAVRGTERTKSLSFRGAVTEQLRGIGPGVKAAKRTLQHGQSADDLAKWDFRQVQFGDSPAGRIAQGYTETVFRTLGAQDSFFRAVAMGRAMEEHARVAAKKMVKDGTAKTFDDAIAMLRTNPPPEIVTDAMLDAEIAVFQQENVLASMWSGGKRIAREKKAPGVAHGMDIVAPFVKTPSNIGGALIQYSPAGFITAATKQLRNPSQKALAENLGRAITGSGLVALGAMLYREGLATGAAPTDPNERAQWDLEGKQANSVHVGDRWLNVSRIAPIGALVAVGAQMMEAKENAKSVAGGAVGAAMTPVRVALDQSFARGVSGALEAVNDPSRKGEIMLEQTAGSVVPALVATIARGTDPYQRAPEGPIERIQSRIPGLSQKLMPKRDALGRPLPSRGGFLRQSFDITQSTRAANDPLIAELSRLDVSIGFPSRYEKSGKGPGAESVKMSPQKYDELLRSAGPQTESSLRTLLVSPHYQSASDELKYRMVQRLIDVARQMAKTQQRLQVAGGKR